MKKVIFEKLRDLAKIEKLNQVNILNNIKEKIKKEEFLINEISNMREQGYKSFTNNLQAVESYSSYVNFLDKAKKERIHSLQILRVQRIRQQDVVLHHYREEEKYNKAIEKIKVLENDEQNRLEESKLDYLRTIDFLKNFQNDFQK